MEIGYIRTPKAHLLLVDLFSNRFSPETGTRKRVRLWARRPKPQKYVLGSSYVHSDLEPVINLLCPTEREILGLTVRYGC